MFIDCTEYNVTLSSSTLQQNTASSGGGLFLQDGTLTSVDTGWGPGGSQDNVPDDIVLASGRAYAEFTSGEKFTCSTALDECTTE